METPRSTTFVVLLAVTALVSASFGALGGFAAYQWFAFSGFGVSSISPDKNIVRMIEEESSAINVVDRVAPAVVSIVVKKKRSEVESRVYSFDDFYYGSLSTNSQNDLDELVEVGAGTGFFVTSDGYLVTNRHVADVEGAVFFVITNDDKEYDAKVIDTDPFFDIAVMKIEGSDFSTVAFGDSNNIKVGQTVIAIGNALSQYQNTVTKGVISGINRRISAYDYTTGGEIIEGAIQTDAAINPGNSGGPLINLRGEVVGMNTAISSGAEGVGFAIPVNEVKTAVESVKKEGRIVRPWLGVRFTMLSKESAKARGLSVNEGALITSGQGEGAVVSGSPAEQAGLKDGDIVIAVDDEKLTEENSLSKVIREHLPGDILKLTVLHGGETFELVVTLAEYEN